MKVNLLARRSRQNNEHGSHIDDSGYRNQKDAHFVPGGQQYTMLENPYSHIRRRLSPACSTSGHTNPNEKLPKQKLVSQSGGHVPCEYAWIIYGFFSTTMVASPINAATAPTAARVGAST